jgi:hypothetical protein
MKTMRLLCKLSAPRGQPDGQRCTPTVSVVGKWAGAAGFGPKRQLVRVETVNRRPEITQSRDSVNRGGSRASLAQYSVQAMFDTDSEQTPVFSPCAFAPDGEWRIPTITTLLEIGPNMRPQN